MFACGLCFLRPVPVPADMGSALSLTIPPATGAHHVGCTDVLVGAGTEGCFFRLFYPCTSSSAGQAHPPWFPRPEYMAGLLGVRGWEGRAAQYGAAFILGNPKIPAIWNGNFLPGLDRKPLIIFSHGLGAFRTLSSSLCMELASNGFLGWFSLCHVPFSEGDAVTPMQEIWVHQRASECIRAVRVLEDIDKGRPVSNIMDSGFSLAALKQYAASIVMLKIIKIGYTHPLMSGSPGRCTRRSGSKDAVGEGPFVTSRSCDRDVTAGPGRTATLTGRPRAALRSSGHQRDGNQGKHRVTKRGPALSNPMFTLVTSEDIAESVSHTPIQRCQRESQRPKKVLAF
ncbi:unnamed protein product [Ranitomeya imitator]|uniref:1-alkyl-2-acetylglycerophosphocholine esterase n=1 Tax=Ranitomeya imitator TaxID=111125 RepID=A0ABN9LL34_9NEOB|nr:unnamed protein product [Ranitomeya imitator]